MLSSGLAAGLIVFGVMAPQPAAAMEAAFIECRFDGEEAAITYRISGGELHSWARDRQWIKAPCKRWGWLGPAAAQECGLNVTNDLYEFRDYAYKSPTQSEAGTEHLFEVRFSVDRQSGRATWLDRSLILPSAESMRRWGDKPKDETKIKSGTCRKATDPALAPPPKPLL